MMMAGGGGDEPVRFAPRTMLVKLTDPADDMPRALLEGVTGHEMGRQIGFGLVPGLHEWEVPEGMERATTELARALPGVEYACLDVIGGELAQVGGQFPVFPNDPDFSKLWWAWNTGQNINGFQGIAGSDVCLPDAWKVRTDASSVKVAVIDTGVNYLKPELAPNIWTNTPEANGVTGVDDDGNGVVDDIHGAAFVAQTVNGADPNCPPGQCGAGCNDFPCDYGEGDPYDMPPEGSDICPTKSSTWPGGHGTCVAQVLGAVGNNGTGSTGVMWHGTIMPIRINSACTNTNWHSKDIIDALGYAAVNGAKIISISYSHPYNEASEDAYGKLGEYDVFVAVAAFNAGINLDSPPINYAPYPQLHQFPHMVKVMGTMPDDTSGVCDTNLSNYGHFKVQIAAPGYLLTHFPESFGGFPAPQCGPGGCTICGTSFSAPMVAGIAALYRAQYPSRTAIDTAKAIVDTARPVPTLANKCVAGGVINAATLMGQECSH